MKPTNNEKSKKAYHSPKLYNYGDVRSLTEANQGAQGQADGQVGYASGSYQDLKTTP